MKTIYFVRHAESLSNAGEVFLFDAALTEKGEEQAQLIAEKVADYPLDIIISSNMQRASQTARAVAEKTGVAVDYSDLFRERRHATAHEGISKADPDFLRFDQEFATKFDDPEWRFADADNFADLKERAFEALDYLVERQEKHILLATHASFLKVMLAAMVFGEELSGRECMRFLGRFVVFNTGLCIARYDPHHLNPWHIISWNDYSHLK